MPLFIILGKLTDTAIQKMREAQERDKKAEQIIASAGGKLVSHYYTFGRYDFVAIIELPSPEILAKVIIEIAKCGTVSTETMTALLPEKMYEMAMGT
ncbi:MAG: GYD domain-containing protein [Methanomicrobiales archaeon]|nr:GYD domain-containing protein [Methanomicrobiales archaeon]NYT21939.1 GYD domain-containing protein [Methanomicrobiales archaeon]